MQSCFDMTYATLLLVNNIILEEFPFAKLFNENLTLRFHPEKEKKEFLNSLPGYCLDRELCTIC